MNCELIVAIIIVLFVVYLFMQNSKENFHQEGPMQEGGSPLTTNEKIKLRAMLKFYDMSKMYMANMGGMMQKIASNAP